MSNTKELLTLAAKAMGFRIHVWQMDENDDEVGATCSHPGKNLPKFNWDPRTDDGDALRLAVKLEISIDFGDACAWKHYKGELIQEYWGGDYPKCYRQAIVRVAAAIGEKLP